VVDKAAILSDIASRNALRQTHGLPLLDVSVEYARQVSVAQQRQYHTACDEHADEREAIRREVLMEYRTRYGADFGASMGGRWAIGHTTLMRFTTYMAEQHGVSPPDPVG
jgi:hypothetical protein